MEQPLLFVREEFVRTNPLETPNRRTHLTAAQWHNLKIALKNIQPPGRYRLGLNGLARKFRDRTRNYNERVRYGAPLWKESWLPHVDTIAEACRAANIRLRNS